MKLAQALAESASRASGLVHWDIADGVRLRGGSRQGSKARRAGTRLKRGAGAFFFFASDDSMALLFQQPEIASLRPNDSGSSGGVSPK